MLRYFQMCPSAWQPGKDDIGTHTKLVLRSEIGFGFVLQPLGCVMVLVVGWTFGEKLAPYVAALSVLFIVRSKAIEAMLIRWTDDNGCSLASLFASDVLPMRSCRMPKMKASLGSLKVADAFSDGMCIGLAILLDGTIHDNFCESFGSGVFWWVQPVASSLHLFGFMIIVLLISDCVQGSLACIDFSSAPALCEAPGFYVLMERIDERDEANKLSDFICSVFAEVCLEQAPQLKFQVSLLMAQGLGVLEQPTVLLSITIGCLTMAAKAVKLLSGELPHILLAMATLLFVAYIVASLAMMHNCEDHMWGITTGCVALN